MRIERKPPSAPSLGINPIKQRVLDIVARPGFRSVTFAPYSLYRQGYSLALTVFDRDGMAKDQLRDPIEAARSLFQGKVEKIVIKRGAKTEDITALFERLNNKTLNLQDFSRPNIEVVFRSRQQEQAPATTPTEAAKPALRATANLIGQPPAISKTVDTSSVMPTSPVKSEPLSQAKPGHIDGFRKSIAGDSGTIVHFRNGENGLLLDRLTHSDRLEFGEFIDTGTILGGHKVYCTKEFLVEVAPIILAVILTEKKFRFNQANTAFYRVTVFANERLGRYYRPQGTMSSEDFMTSANLTGHDFPFRLTAENFSRDWTAKDLVLAMAQRPLKAVAVDVQPAQSAKPARPVNCATLDDLRETCAQIFKIGYSPSHSEPFRQRWLALFLTRTDIRPWLEHLATEAALAAEYPEYQKRVELINNPGYYPMLIRSALFILKQHLINAG